jgi:hypothetical protein
MTCTFPSNFDEEALITAVVSGFQKHRVRKHLMQRNLETLEGTFNTAETLELVLIEASKVNNSSTEEFNVNKINRHRKHQLIFIPRQTV